MKDYEQYEQEILAAVGKLLISKLAGRDDLAHAIFNALIPQFQDRYPYHKILTETVLGQVEEDDSKEDIIASLRGHTLSVGEQLADLANELPVGRLEKLDRPPPK